MAEDSRFARVYPEAPELEEKLRELQEALEPEEREVVEKEEGGEHWFLERFLRARQMDVQQAHQMITHYCKWKRDFQPATPLVRRRYMAKGIVHVLDVKDRWKRPVIYYRAERHNPSNRDVSVEEICAVAESVLREQIVELQSHDRNHRKLVGIVDLANFGRKHVDFSLVKAGIPFAQDLFPELIGAILIINSPFIIHGLWGVVKPWLDHNTKEKIVFASGAELREILEELFEDADALPEDLMGKAPALPAPLVDAFAPDAQERLLELVPEAM